MYPSSLKYEFREARRARRQEKFIIFFFTGCAAYVAGVGTVMWVMAQIIG